MFLFVCKLSFIMPAQLKAMSIALHQKLLLMLPEAEHEPDSRCLVCLLLLSTKWVNSDLHRDHWHESWADWVWYLSPDCWHHLGAAAAGCVRCLVPVTILAWHCFTFTNFTAIWKQWCITTVHDPVGGDGINKWNPLFSLASSCLMNRLSELWRRRSISPPPVSPIVS